MPQKGQSRRDQLDLFDDLVTEGSLLWRAHAELKESHDRTRRRLFSEVQELRDLITDLMADVERIKYRHNTTAEDIHEYFL